MMRWISARTNSIGAEQTANNRVDLHPPLLKYIAASFSKGNSFSGGKHAPDQIDQAGWAGPGCAAELAAQCCQAWTLMSQSVTDSKAQTGSGRSCGWNVPLMAAQQL